MGFEVRVDCRSCTAEGTCIETWDPELASCRLGVPDAVRCKLCGDAKDGQVFGVHVPAAGDGCPGCGALLDAGSRARGDCASCGARAVLVERATARSFTNLDELDRALDSWAREEGLASSQDLIDAYFVLPSVSAVFAALQRGERVETTFDVADYLFSGGAAGGAAAGEPIILRRDEDEGPRTERSPRPVSLRPVAGPRDELLAIASVAAADGEASPDDRAMLQRACEKRGMPPLGPEDIRVWRPNELAPPNTLVDRERVLEEMFQMGWSDGQMDESELRVIRDFARAWGIDPERLREWTDLYSFGDSNRLERWFRRIGFFLFPAR